MGVIRAFKSSLPVLAIFAVALAGCGSDAASFDYEPPRADRPAPPADLFPDASGKTLRQVVNSADGSVGSLGLHMESTALVFYKGRNRYPIQITTGTGSSVDDMDVALYVAKVQGSESGKHLDGKAVAQAEAQALDSLAQGPFPIRMDTLATEPQFTARSTVENSRSATVVYVGRLNFPTNGKWRLAAVVRDGKETVSVVLPTVLVGEFSHVPKVGQRPPLIHTSTAASMEGDLEAISTRRPPTTMNEVDFASVLGRKPILLVFASPKFSWNGTAGPTLDVAEQVRERFKGQVDFISSEIYNDNDPSKRTRPQVRAFHLPSEPWLFAIDRQGRVVGEIEGAVGVAELTRLARKALGGQPTS